MAIENQETPKALYVRLKNQALEATFIPFSNKGLEVIEAVLNRRSEPIAPVEVISEESMKRRATSVLIVRLEENGKPIERFILFAPFSRDSLCEADRKERKAKRYEMDFGWALREEQAVRFLVWAFLHAPNLAKAVVETLMDWLGAPEEDVRWFAEYVALMDWLGAPEEDVRWFAEYVASVAKKRKEEALSAEEERANVAGGSSNR